MTAIKQYQVVIVNLDPTQGSEIRKTRPCVVISPNEMNQFLNTIVIAPLTSSVKALPTRVAVNLEEKISFMAIDQIRTIDKSLIIKLLSQLTELEIKTTKEVLLHTFVL